MSQNKGGIGVGGGLIWFSEGFWWRKEFQVLQPWLALKAQLGLGLEKVEAWLINGDKKRRGGRKRSVEVKNWKKLGGRRGVLVMC